MPSLSINNLLQGEITNNEVVNSVFEFLEEKLKDRNEVVVDLQDVTFISVYFLEKLEGFTQRAKRLNKKVQIVNVQPPIYKVFQVARSKMILEFCV